MIIKVVDSVADAFKDKFKNPFFGTLIAVWIIRNRRFVFNLFINENYDSDKRLELLTNHFKAPESLISLLLTICYSILLMALIFIALNISRYVVEFSERVVYQKILQSFKPENFPTPELYKKMEAQKEYYEKKYNEEKEEKFKLQNELDKAKERVFVEPNAFDYINIKNIIDEWSDSDIIQDFEKLIGLVNKKDSVQQINQSIKSIQTFLNKNIIEKKLDGEFAHHTYKFTELGEKIRDEYLNNN